MEWHNIINDGTQRGSVVIDYMNEETKQTIIAYNAVIGLTYEEIAQITGESIEDIKEVVYERFPELKSKEDSNGNGSVTS